MFNHFYQINFLVCKKKFFSFLFELFSVNSVEYPYELPQREENIQPSSSNSVETITGLTKNMKLNGNKTIDGQGYFSNLLLLFKKKIIFCETRSARSV
jgi:hypothetical protein